MATVTLLTLRTRIREELGIELADEVLTDVELNARINLSGAKLHNRFVKADEDYLLTSSTFTLTSPTNTVSVPAFWKARGLEFAVNASQDVWQDVEPFGFTARNQQVDRSFRITGATTLRVLPWSMAWGDYRFWYIPAFVTMTADTDTIETLNGFERLIIAEVSAWGLAKRMLDASPYVAEVKQLEADIDAYLHDRHDTGTRAIRDVRPRRWRYARARFRSTSTDFDL